MIRPKKKEGAEKNQKEGLKTRGISNQKRGVTEKKKFRKGPGGEKLWTRDSSVFPELGVNKRGLSTR